MLDMKRDDLIKKWLDNALSSEETKAFKALEDYSELVKLDAHLKNFKAPEYSTQDELNTLIKTTQSKPSKQKQWLQPLLKIAAILAVCFGIYQYTTTLDTSVNTLASQKTTIELPDNSEVILNAGSTITYNKNNWENNRSLNFKGEAFFKVKKGSDFSVLTPSGKVTVLGTQFNVKQRYNYFEVTCYEGSVKVENANHTEILKPGDRFLLLNNVLIEKQKETAINPSWTTNLSSFKSLPFSYVLNEFKRQYNVSFQTKDIDTTIVFTGNFPHNNLEQALKSITTPLSLKYQIKANTIELTRD
jgi:ferric-dicitrate binding protein FerR (iron transport regulator)